MNRLLLSTFVLAALTLSACSSHQRKSNAFKQSIGKVITVSDKYVAGKKPTYAVRNYNRYIPYYSAFLRGYPELKPDVARMHVKRAEAYSLVRNNKMVQADIEAARALDPNVTVSVSGEPSAAPLQPQPQPGPGPSQPGPQQPQPQPALDQDGIPAHEGEPIRVAVLDFEENVTGRKYGMTFAGQLGEGLLNRGRFETIERERLQEVIAEQNLSQSDLMSKAGSAEAGRLLEVRYIISGSISVEGNAVIANARIMDWTTGQILVSQTSKKICPDANVSFYFDEIAHDLGVKLEKAYVAKYPE